MGRRGVTEPRVFTQPLQKLTHDTTLGFAFIDFCALAGTELLPWQRWLAVHALEVRGDIGGEWEFRFNTVLVLVSRQNGKTEFLKLLSLFFMYVLGAPLTLGTAQNLDYAEDVWEQAVEVAEGNPELSPEVERVARKNGSKALYLNGGQAYRIVAATRKGGRGKSADLVLMDEMREQTTWDAWGAISKTTMARPNAQLWAFSNAGDAKSVVLRHLRTMGHAACGDPDGVAATNEGLLESTDLMDGATLGLFEWSAEPGCAINDREQWAQANPSLGYGFLTEKALASACATDPEQIFRTECLCQWVDVIATSPFPPDAWENGTDPDSEIPADAPLSFGIDVSANRSMTAIAVCGRREDGNMHAEVVAYRTGFDWALDWLRERVPRYGRIRIALQARGAPVSSHIDELRAIRGLEVVECEGRDVGSWCGRFYDAVAACAGEADCAELMHRPQPALDEAAAVAQTRPLGDGAWGWDRKRSASDIAPLVAATMAHGLATVGRTEKRTYTSAYAADRPLLVV